MFVDGLKKHRCVLDEEGNDGNSRGRGNNYYQKCVSMLDLLRKLIIKTFRACPGMSTDIESQGTGPQGAVEEGYARCRTCILPFRFGVKVILAVLGVLTYGVRIGKIREKKRQHAHASEIMDLLIEYESSYKYNNNGQEPVMQFKPGIDCPNDDDDDEIEAQDMTLGWRPSVSFAVKKDTPLLMAAKMGIPEMVDKIRRTFPVAIQDLDSNGKNVLLLAAENRHYRIFNYLLRLKLPEGMFYQVDDEGNGILHLAAAMHKDGSAWRIGGADTQMQWEYMWYKYVKHQIPRASYVGTNNKGETPEAVFTKTHEGLVVRGNQWLTKTSESCSLVAALVATVAFATSATVPGGLDQNTGHPTRKDSKAFDIFSVSSLVALCLSVAALILFLSIITSRFQESSFKYYTTWKLLTGLTALLASIVAMLVSFCAGHTFNLRHGITAALLPVFAIALVPMTLFALSQLTLYFFLVMGYTELLMPAYRGYSRYY